ncbi:hypothetical protein D3C85_919400 [compost metagenome]
MGATANVLHDAVHLLRAVRHADGEHQKRHENRIRIEDKAEQMDEAQLPDHRDLRTQQYQQRAAHAASIEIDHECCRHRRDDEISHHLYQPVYQIADQLGKADDLDMDLVALLGANLVFQSL